MEWDLAQKIIQKTQFKIHSFTFPTTLRSKAHFHKKSKRSDRNVVTSKSWHNFKLYANEFQTWSSHIRFNHLDAVYEERIHQLISCFSSVDSFYRGDERIQTFDKRKISHWYFCIQKMSSSRVPPRDEDIIWCMIKVEQWYNWVKSYTVLFEKFITNSGLIVFVFSLESNPNWLSHVHLCTVAPA